MAHILQLLVTFISIYYNSNNTSYWCYLYVYYKSFFKMTLWHHIVYYTHIYIYIIYSN